MNMQNNVYITQRPVCEPFEMGTRDNLFTLILALLSIPFVSLTLWGGFNSGYTVSVILSLTLFSVYLFNKKIKFKLFPFLCLFMSVCASLIFTYSADTSVRFFLVLLLTLSAFIWFAYLGGYDLSDDYLLVSAVSGGILGSIFGNVAKSIKTVFSGENKNKKTIIKILAGAVCAIPAIIVLVMLLRSSDAAFDGLLSQIGKRIGNVNSLVFKVIVGVLFFPFALSLGLGLAKNKREQVRWQIKSSIDKIFVLSFLSAISVVYVAYIFSQFAYFFNAFKGLLPDGITASSYARRGFFEMTVIAAINFVIISFASVFTKKKENGKRNASVNAVIVFIGVFTILLIATALSKMILYINIFGMTRLRILTSAFMLFLAVLFIAVILRVYINKISVIKTGIITATLILLVVGFADVDKTVAKYNLYAYNNEYIEDLDVEALGDLGYGAVPTLYEIYNNQDYSRKIRLTAKKELNQKVEIMFYITEVDNETVYERKTNAGSFNVSEYKAQKVLEDFLGI